MSTWNLDISMIPRHVEPRHFYGFSANVLFWSTSAKDILCWVLGLRGLYTTNLLVVFRIWNKSGIIFLPKPKSPGTLSSGVGTWMVNPWHRPDIKTPWSRFLAMTLNLDWRLGNFKNWVGGLPSQGTHILPCLWALLKMMIFLFHRWDMC